MSHPFDPLRFPLHGSRLIEASAGTGKTYALALLYVRLVLGHGPAGAAFPRPLTPPEILVVTFTEAATQELRDRIRLRLVEAAACFEQSEESAASSRDPLLALRDSYPPVDWPLCARRLRLAADWMDEAVISTIHGWCNRMLREHAFDTRGLFDRELVPEQGDLVSEVVRDYWRVHFYPLTPTEAAAVRTVLSSPADLEKKLKEWLGRRDLRLSYKGDPLDQPDLTEALRQQCAWLAEQTAAEAAGAALASRLSALEDAARAQWRADRTGLEQQLHALRPHLNGTTHGSAKADVFDALLAEIAQWSEGGSAPSKLKTFATGAFSFKKTAPVQSAPAHPAFQAIADWQAALGERCAAPAEPEPAFLARLLAHAAGWIAPELERRLQQRAEMGFDDLLSRLDVALDPAAGEPAERLAQTIRRQFPIALIDEFQDTDPVQYRIFDRIYDVPGSAPDRGLVMIGDPKQAIYGFRGADIHAYLDARTATSGRHYSLGKNYRSTAAVVQGCNHIFRHAETQPRGAFRFAKESDNPIPFQPVEAEGRAERLELDGRPAPAITLWTLDDGDEPIGSADYRDRMAESAATQIADWLTQSRSGSAGFSSTDGRLPLRPRDIAILVRSGTEAARIRQALAARRIASVYLSDRDSVFGSQEARDLLHWLRACAAPGDEGLVRAALGTNTLAIPLETLWRLFEDELGWELQMERFRTYRSVWQRQGVLAMLSRLMQDAELPARLLARDDGERALTNLLHLAEWLQQAATAIDGEQALIRHLDEQLDDQGEEAILRLESDAELVQVITIHKAKGLEYPLVLLPFVCSWREVDGKQRQVPYRRDSERFLEIAGKGAFATAWQAADDARLSEDMRLLYVALTRARHGLWLGIAPLKKGTAKRPQLERSAIGYVLGGGASFASPAEIWSALDQLAAGSDAIRIAPAPEPGLRRLEPEAAWALELARPAPRLHQPAWWITSYSAIERGALPRAAPEDGAPAPRAGATETAAQETALEEAAAAPPRAAPVRLYPDKHMHALPRGSRYGTFMHGLLEWAAKARLLGDDGQVLEGFAAAAQSSPLRREMLGQRCNLRRLTEWITPLDAWMADFLTREWVLHGLPGADGQPPRLRLCDLPPERVQVEMEFWIESHGVDIAALDRLVQTQIHVGQARPALGAHHINGLLKGFIDLVFEHEGRYYVVDWKSNWLGSDDSAYRADAMREAILHKRYDLQYVLYLLALHRQLKARLPDYDYDRHMGGAVYVFLRGSYAETQGLFMDKPPRALIEGLDRLFRGEARAVAETLQ